MRRRNDEKRQIPFQFPLQLGRCEIFKPYLARNLSAKNSYFPISTMTTPTDGSMLGLGFGNHSSSTEGSVDDMMQHYLQQCLEFHNEQTKLKEQQEEQEAQNVQFVPPVKEEERILQPSLQEAVSKAKEVIQSFPPVRSEAVVAAMAKAKAIVANFQLSPPQPTTDSLLPCDYKNRRMAFFERQSKRLEKALYKNFAYIAKRDEERLQQKLQQVEAAKQLEQRMRDEHVRKLQQRAANQQQLQAGIGTTVQRKASRKRKAEQVSLRKQEQDPSLYMSGLPTATITEDLIRGLFASYGKIRRVQFYRNKQTGALKGDGLIAYDSAGIEDPASFLLSICVQVSVRLFDVLFVVCS